MFNFGPKKKNTPGTKLYEVLGVNKDATSAEIKKQFKTLSLKYHPDRPNGDTKKFQEINLANETLSDPEKRKIYDEYGEEGLEQMAQGGGGVSPFPEDLIDLIMPGMRRRSQQQRSGPRQSDSIGVNLEVSLENLYTGKTVKFEYKRNMKCSDCKGVGSKDKDALIDCRVCKGQGKRVEIRQMGMMIQQQVLPCQVCNATGKVIKDGKECEKCIGKRIMSEDIQLEIPIRPGTSQGDRICMKGKAHDNPDCEETGDLFLIIVEKASKTGLKREGNDLVYQKEIDLVDALCGVEFYIKHLDERYIKSSYSGIIHPGQVMKLDGEGMPKQNNEMGFGDMYIKFDISFPNKLNEKRIQLLQKILPKSEDALVVSPSEGDSVDEKTMTTVESKYQSSYNNMRTEMTEDMVSDEDEGGGAPECVQQ